MIRPIFLAVAAIPYSMAFAPPRLLPAQLYHHVDVAVAPILKGTQHFAGSGTGSSLLLSWICSCKTALHASTDSSSKDHRDSYQKYVNYAEHPGLVTAAGGCGLGEFNPDEKLGLERETANVGDPQTQQLEPMNITKVLTELQAIQSQGPKKYCILGTRHCSFLHQQIVEMLAYALCLSGNHVYTSGAAGTNAAAIRGALRAFQPQLLTVVLPQSMSRQTPESQELLQDVTNVVTMPQNDAMPLDVASRICNSHLLSQTDHLISFAFHESKTVLEAAQEAQKLDMLVTLLYLD